MPSYGMLDNGRLKISETAKPGYKELRFDEMPEFDQSSQFIRQEAKEYDTHIHVAYIVSELPVDPVAEENEMPAEEFIEPAPWKEVRPADEVELLRAQNKALSDRSDFIEELIFEVALQVYE